MSGNESVTIPASVSNTLMSLQSRYNHYNQNASHNFPSQPAPTLSPPSQTENIPHAVAQTPSSSVINLSSSSDVVIGPMTQYQGAVTIYQYMDATVETSARAHRQPSTQPRRDSEPIQCCQERYFIYFILLFLTIIAISTALYFALFQNQKESFPFSQKEILFGNNYESGTIPNLGNGHLIIDRHNWGSQENASGKYRLEHPILYVVVTHIGVQSIPCYNLYKCSIKMRTIQDSAIVERGLPDLSNNFYLGNDGYVYVGRGWDVSNTYANKTLSVCFMGDFQRYETSASQFSALEHLLTYGIVNDYLARDYKLVAHNQTKKTSSPGANVYKYIIKQPRWSMCGNPGYSRCGTEIGLPDVWDGRM